MIIKPKFEWSNEVDDYVCSSLDVEYTVEEILIVNKALSIIANYGGANPYDRAKARELMKIIKEGVNE